MAETFQVADEELMYRAGLYELYYEVPKEDVFQILKRLEIIEVDQHPYLDNMHLKFQPSFEDALRFFTPRVAVGIFKSASLTVLSDLLLSLNRIAKNVARQSINIEDMVRWEVEKYMLPD